MLPVVDVSQTDSGVSSSEYFIRGRVLAVTVLLSEPVVVASSDSVAVRACGCCQQ